MNLSTPQRQRWRKLKSLPRQLTCNLAYCLVAIAMLGQAGISHARDLTFTSWTGPYMRSQMLGFVRPYEAQSNSSVHVAHYAGGIEQIRDQVESANVVWDVVDLTQADSLRACREGLLEDLNNIELPAGANGVPASADFVDGALNECGVGVIIWATAFAYNQTRFTESAPSSIADFFDTKTYPGKRAIRKDPSVIMEWALIADGVAPQDVYTTLETDEGIARAFKKMSAIRPGLVFWSSGSEPIRLLNNDEVALSMIWATTGASAAQDANAKFDLVWDGRVTEVDLFGIPKGSPNKAAAKEFIRFASSSESLAKMASYLPNGPTRQSSLALLDEKIQAQLPNGPSYANQTSLRSDAKWWSANYPRIKEAFDQWLKDTTRHGAAGTVR